MSTLRFMTAGESHGSELIAIIDGLPAGLRLEEDYINYELARRQQGYGRGDRQKIESDTINVVSGLRFGETLGGPLTLVVKNRDFANWTAKMSAFGKPTDDIFTAIRPGHADLAGALKYNRQDIRDILERSSARETTMRVAVGAIAKTLLRELGIEIMSHVTSIGGVAISKETIDYKIINESKANSELNVSDSKTEMLMKKRIDEAKSLGDTLGGIFEVVVMGLPIGLGSHVQGDRRLDGKLAGAIMSIQAIKGVEIGLGFECANRLGSQIHDEIFIKEENGEKKVYRKTNRTGGLEGGMTNGEMLILRAAMKPIPTLMTPLNTVDYHTLQPVKASKERSDVCAVPAASLVGEAMVAITLAQEIIDKFSSDTMIELKDSFKAYNERLGKVWTR